MVDSPLPPVTVDPYLKDFLVSLCKHKDIVTLAKGLLELKKRAE